MKKNFLLIFFACMLLMNFTSIQAISGDTFSGETQEIADLIESENYETELVSGAISTTVATYKGTVVTAGNQYEEKDELGTVMPYQDVRVRIKENGVENIVYVKYQLSFFYGSSIPADELKPGDKVYVTVTYDESGGITQTYIEYISNERFLFAMIAIYALAIILIGGKKGVRALVSLILTVLGVFYIMVPLIYEGFSPVLSAVLTSVLVTLITFFIVAGPSKKTVAAILGTTGGIIVAGIFAMIFGNFMKLTGSCSDALTLSMMEEAKNFDYEGIMVAGIIIGALGACMDVGMSIASALHELSVESGGMTTKKLIKSGMNIGKDVMGTMTNTLILAYVGSSLIIILLFKGYNLEPYQIFNNTEQVLEEVLRAIAGSFGLVFTIPITAIISSILMGKKEETKNEWCE